MTGATEEVLVLAVFIATAVLALGVVGAVHQAAVVARRWRTRRRTTRLRQSATGRVSRFDVEARKHQIAVGRADTQQLAAVTDYAPGHEAPGRHAAPETADRAALLADLDKAGWPAGRLAEEADR